MKKLSERAYEILQAVREATSWEGDEVPGDVLKSFFVPQSENLLFIDDWDGGTRDIGRIWGPGDAAILKSFLRKRLTKDETARGVGEFCCSITEEGMCVLQDEEERRRSKGEIK